MATAAMPLHITVGTPQHMAMATPLRRIAMATLPHTTADMGTGAWFAPHMHTVADTIAGIGTVGDRQLRR